MIRIQMNHIATRTVDGLIHVQNYVGWRKGQHHIHTEESFRRWNEHHESKVEVEDGECNCGLDKAGMVRSYDGHVSFNDRFLKAEFSEEDKERDFTNYRESMMDEVFEKEE